MLTINLGILPFCYAFTNWDSREGYATLFRLIFSTIANAGRFVIQFPYIHNTNFGIRTIGVDMCKKQAGGKHTLSIYTIYTNYSRSWGLSSST